MEELNNIRDNVNKAIITKEFSAGLSQDKRNSTIGEDEDEDVQEFDENFDNISHLSKMSVVRKEYKLHDVADNGIKSKTQSST